MNVEMVIISSMTVLSRGLFFELCTLNFVLCSLLLSASKLITLEVQSTKYQAQILMFRIFLTISMPVTCRNSAATIK